MSGYGGGYGQGGYGQGGYGQGGGYSAGGYGNNRYDQASQNPYGQAAGNPYGGAGGGYGQSNPYGQSQPQQQQQQPYDPPRPTQSNPYGQQSNYTGGAYPAQTQNAQQNGSSPHEMKSLSLEVPQPPEVLRDHCSRLGKEINGIRQLVTELTTMHAKARDAVDTNPATNKTLAYIDSHSSEIMKQNRLLTRDIRLLKGQPQGGDEMVAPQIASLDTRLRAVMNEFRTEDATYQGQLRAQLKRQYKIVRPDATEAEANEAAEEQNAQIFSQALMQSDRRGQAQSTLTAVKSRHEAIAQIAKQMNEVATLAKELNEAIIVQEEQVTQIDHQAETVQSEVAGANVELGGAVKKARAARKKKWICLGIVVAIIVIIVIIIAIVVAINHSGSSSTAPKSGS